MHMAGYPLLGNDNGGMGLRILLAAVTLALLGAAVFAIVGTYQNTLRENNRKAEQISAYGLQSALQTLGTNPQWRDGLPKTDYLSGWYKVTIEPREGREPSVISVISEGHSGPAVKRQICELQLSITDGDSVWTQESYRLE